MRPASALLVLLGLVPLAGAHAIPADFTIEPFSQVLPFDGETSTRLVFDYRCGGMSSEESERNMSVRFAVDSAPAWARLTIEPETLELPECEGVGRATAELVASADPDAVSLEDADVVVNSTWLTGGYELVQTATVAVRTPFVAAFDVEIAETNATAKPQTVVVFPITLTSQSTGTMRLTFEVVDRTGPVEVPVPPPITLQGPDGPRRAASVPLVVQTPYRNGFIDEDATVTYRITPEAALDPTIKGEPREITVRVHTEGFYVPSAGAGLALAALAIVSVALGRRARR